MALTVQGGIGMVLQMGDLRSHDSACHHRMLERDQPYGRHGRAHHRDIHNRGGRTRNIRLPVRKHHKRGIPQHNVHTWHRRDRCLHGGFRRGAHRIPLAQLLPCPGIHGRYGQSDDRRGDRRMRHPDQEGTPASRTVRSILRGDPFRNDTEKLFQIYQEKVRGRTQGIQDDSPAPSFPEGRDTGTDNKAGQGIARGQDRGKVLDCRDHSGRADGRPAENQVAGLR